MPNKIKCTTLLFLTAAILPISLPSTVQAEDTFFDALTKGDVSFSARLRYESVEQDNALEDADALTLRTTLGYKTADFYGVSGFIEFEDVSDLGSDDHNSTTNGNGSYSVIADPKGTEINQSYLSYKFGANKIRYGRQEIFYRKTPFHRFVGNVLWRQNHQSYNGLRFTSEALSNTKLEYSYIDEVHTIFGEDRTAGIIVDGDIDVRGHLLSAQYSGLSFGTLSGYTHLLDYKDAPTLSNKIIGLRLNGGKKINDDSNLIYTVEFAQQDGYKDGTTAEHGYTLLEVGGKYKGWLTKLSYEMQEGDGTSSFKTRLGTNHAYQGWADQFLSTPNEGLEDLYITVVGKVLGGKTIIAYHDFKTDEGSIDAGNELNLLFTKKIAGHYTVGLKYADYSAGDLAGKVDTQKSWLFTAISF